MKLLIQALLLLAIIWGTSNSLRASDGINGKKRPNIIFLLTDDHRWDALGVMGNSIIETPNMDKLARQGVLYENAFVTTSICCVSRASILTGQYESHHGIHDFGTELSAEAFAKSYPKLLKDAGYTVGFAGKYGVGHHPPVSSFDFFVDTEGEKGQPDYLVPNGSGELVHDTDSLNTAILNFLDQFGEGAPFCLSVSFKAPHELDGNPPTYVVQERYKDLYKDVKIPYPVTAAPEYWERLPDVLRTEENFGRVRWKGLFGTPELYQENVKNYYRLITGVDDVLGNVMQKLREINQDSNTVIIYMGDNGMLLGEHGMEGKWYGYDESTRVPLFIYDPRLPDQFRQLRAPQLALNIDIAPTILGLAGVSVPEEMQGVNLIDLVKGNIPERKDFFYQHYFLGAPRIPRVEGVINADYRYMNYIEVGYEQLFDVKHDPNQINNLVGNPAFNLKLEEMRRRYKELKILYGVPEKEWDHMKENF